MPICACDSFVLTSDQTRSSLMPGSYVHQVFADFDSFPRDRTAIIDYDTGARLSFADLKRLTGNVASGLAKRGFGKGQVLSLFGANCIENAPIAFGAVLTGGAIQLVKPVASQDELRFHFSLVSPKVIVTTTNRAQAVKEAVRATALQVQDIFVIGDAVEGCHRVEELLEDPGDTNPWGQVEIDPHEDVAFLLQTGGTTGMSKTVMHTHQALKIGGMEAFGLQAKSDGDEVTLGYIPFNHSFSMCIMYGSWLRRGCSVVNINSKDPETLIKAIEKHRVTRMCITPVMMFALQACPYFEKANLSSLRFFFCGGAPMTKETQEKISKNLQKLAPKVSFNQLYGMTELGAISWSNLRPTDPKYKQKAGSNGQIIGDIELRVVSCDDQKRNCKPGQRGHIVLRSPRIMKGYFKNEEKTRKVIIDGWLQTGDYGYFDKDGYVFVLDRVEDLIQLKDGIVVPTHVEAVLRTNPNIKDVAVVGRPGGTSGEPVTVAFVVKEGNLTEKEVRRFAAENLAPHEQLSGGVRFVASIPKSPAGKMLRRELV